VLRRFAGFLAVFQSVLFLGHFFLFETLLFALGSKPTTAHALAWSLAILSICFLGSSLLGFRYYHLLVRILYRISAVWLGAFTYLFIAACAWWIIYGALSLLNISVPYRELSLSFFGAALLVSVYGVIHGAFPQVKRVTVRLRGLPDWWQGRSIALISDLHLGNIRGAAFVKRAVNKILAETAELAIIAGDLFDGTPIDAAPAAAPLAALRLPLGAFFTEGNHEEFRDTEQFLAAVANSGVRVLDNEKVELHGLQLLGVPYRHATHTEHFQSVLAKLQIDRARASILVTHAPDRPQVAEAAGISLQLSGHTHHGQYFPFTWVAARIYRQFVYGLSSLGGLQVYTSCGAGSWGPPLRVGSTPEIVIIRLERAN
jgi:predicted MPP superfamily phosphohydrolase